MMYTVIDVHCHILPGLDDGADDLEETLAMLRFAAREGVSHMIATPHFNGGRHSAQPGAVQQALWTVRQAAAQEGIPVRVYPGNEIYYFDGLTDCLMDGGVFTLNGGRHVLTEFSPIAQFSYIRNAADELLGGGYVPVIAHAERYDCLTGNADNVRYLKDMGAEIQLNTSSVTGKNGMKARRFAHRILREQLVDYIGTDAHGSRHRTPEAAKCREILERRCGQDYARWILHDHAAQLLGLE